MKMTLIFPSRESEDLSFGACFIASFAWLQGNKIVKEYPHSPKYPEGALGDLISELKLKQKIPSDQSDLVIVKHPNGHGDEDDFKAISTEAVSLGFKPNVVTTRFSEVNNSSDDSDEMTSELFACEFRELVYSYKRAKALSGGEAKFTQSDLARKLGLSESAFSKLMSGNNMSMPSRTIMRKITEFFGREIINGEPHRLSEKMDYIKKDRLEIEKEIYRLEVHVIQLKADLEQKSVSAVDRENNKEQLSKNLEALLIKAVREIDCLQNIKTELLSQSSVVKKELSICEVYSKDMKKSLDKLKHIYLGGI